MNSLIVLNKNDNVGVSQFIIPEKTKIDGQDIKNVNLFSLRKEISIVDQNVTLFDDTIFNNIKYAKSKDRTDIPTYLWDKHEHYRTDILEKCSKLYGENIKTIKYDEVSVDIFFH